jgi:hypothetical protein
MSFQDEILVRSACHTRHIWAWFEDNQVSTTFLAHGGSCGPDSNPRSVSERIAKEAILLKSGEHRDGAITPQTNLFGGLKPGSYRMEAILTGWREEEFDQVERSPLAKMPGLSLEESCPLSPDPIKALNRIACGREMRCRRSSPQQLRCVACRARYKSRLALLGQKGAGSSAAKQVQGRRRAGG